MVFRGLESLGKATDKATKKSKERPVDDDLFAPPPLDLEPDDGDEVIDEGVDGVDNGAPAQRNFPCGNCGAMLTISSASATCIVPTVGLRKTSLRTMRSSKSKISLPYSKNRRPARKMVTAAVTHCDGCGAEVTPPPDVDSFACPYCTTPVVCSTIEHRVMQPHGVVPFALDRQLARKRWQNWLSKLWFCTK